MDLYIAFVVGLVLGACVAFVTICMAAARELGDLPNDEPARQQNRIFQD